MGGKRIPSEFIPFCLTAGEGPKDGTMYSGKLTAGGTRGGKKVAQGGERRNENAGRRVKGRSEGTKVISKFTADREARYAAGTRHPPCHQN